VSGAPGQSTASPEAWKDRYTAQRNAAAPAQATNSQWWLL